MKKPLHDGGDEEPGKDVFHIENLIVIHLDPDIRTFEYNLWNSSSRNKTQVHVLCFAGQLSTGKSK